MMQRATRAGPGLFSMNMPESTLRLMKQSWAVMCVLSLSHHMPLAQLLTARCRRQVVTWFDPALKPAGCQPE